MTNFVPSHAEATATAAAAAPAAAHAAALDAPRRAFLGIEAEHALFDRTADGCRAWDYLRVEVYDALIRGLGLLGEKHDAPHRTWRGYARHSAAVAQSLVRHNPFFARPAELCVIAHPRRRLEPDGTYWDPYTDPLLDGLQRDALVLERPYLNQHRSPAHPRRIAHLDALALAAAARRAVRPTALDAADTAWLLQLEQALAREFDVAVPVRAMAIAKLALRRAQLPLWRRLLRRISPRAVLLVVSYGNEIPIEACRHLGIPTVELQHGVISPQNLGYHFPLPGCRKELFPDWLFTFGDFWRTAAAFPLPRDRVVSVGFPYLEMRRSTTRTAQPRRGVLIVSQKSNGVALSRLAVELRQRLEPDTPVIYKLHPGEQRDWRINYPWLAASPVRVIQGDHPHLYDLFTQSELQIGTYSTALFEGLSFGLETCVAALPGAEALAHLVDACEAAHWVRGVEDVVRALRVRRGRSAPIDAGAWFAGGAIENAEAALGRALATTQGDGRSAVSGRCRAPAWLP